MAIFQSIGLDDAVRIQGIPRLKPWEYVNNPVFGVLLSAWWLREGSKELGINALIALVLVCIGISIVNINKAAEK